MVQSALKKSTIVRSIRRAQLRAGFVALEHTAPALGARKAERFWFELPAEPLRRPSDTSTGRPFEVRSQGGTVRGTTWGEGPVVYLVHGWGGAGSQLDGFVRPLVSAGCAVVAHDAPSHGYSDPGPTGARTSDAVQLARALGDVGARFGPAHAVVAHSMGTLSTALALSYGSLEAERLAFVSPIVRLTDHVATIRAALGYGPRTDVRVAERAQERVGVAVTDLDLERLLLDRDDSLDLLVVHDEQDKEAPYASVREAVAGRPGVRLETTRGLGHRRILGDADVVRHVVDHVAAQKHRGLTGCSDLARR